MIHFTTNLDLAKPYVWRLAEKWKSNMPPRSGEKVVFDIGHECKIFMLEVVDVRWDEAGNATVELHMGNATPCQNILEWEEWFKRHTGHMRLQ